MQSIRSFRVGNGDDEAFEVRKTGNYREGKVISTGYKVVFGMAHLTPAVVRKLAAWLLKAADFCDKANQRPFK